MKKVLFLILILWGSPLFGIKILYPGVKVNNKPLEQAMYLLTEIEFKDMIKNRETVKTQKEMIAEKDIQIRAYKKALDDLIQNVNKVSEQSYQLIDKLLKIVDEKNVLLKENKKLHRKIRNNNFFNLFLLGLEIGKSNKLN